ncbi:hypothetical protein C5O23_08000 [Duncaniella muris]|uniref:BIG2 domain-containing protein n=1 Tax=Duncaniella muris TaxID=2094150 RepID=A0A2V1IKQ5_9BACT|nr:hypothetical protein C5O23_08000 [Duncaniella muris]
MLLGLGANAQEVLSSIEFKQNSTDYEKIGNYTDTWKSTDEKWVFKGFNNNKNGWDFIAGGRKNNASEPYFYTGVYAAPVSKIVIGIAARYTASAITSATLYVADTNTFENAVKTSLTLPTGANSDWTITIPNPAENKYYKVGLVIPSQKSNGQAISINKITVYGKSDKADAEYAFSKASVCAPLGSSIDAPDFTCAEGAPAPEYVSSNTDVATVNSATGAVTIVGVGTAEISAKSESNDKFLAGSASYKVYVGQPVNSIAETMAITDKATLLYINYPLTVAFKNFNNTFACNGNDFIQVYGTQPAYTVGDVIPAGWIGCYDLFNKTTPEIINPIDMPEATENNGFTPAKVSEITTADVNKVVTIENVVFAEATPSTKDNFTGTVNGSEVAMRNNYTIKGVEAGTYNVTGVVAIYSGKAQFNVTGYEKVVDTGIADIVADENAPVEYFNLQGIRVENPENGLYIRRQGNKVTKVIVK